MDRLAAIPAEFLAGFCRPGENDGLKLSALVNDLLVESGDPPVTESEVKILDSHSDRKPHSRIISLLCHIYHDPVFVEMKVSTGYIRKFIFSQSLEALGASVDDPEIFVTDSERREELCRFALNCVNMYPSGEDEKKAKERLLALDSVERKKILDKTRQAQERAREIREAMLRREAEEAASKMSRE